MSRSKGIANLNLDRAIVSGSEGDWDWDEYRPTGLCATGCGHPATELWILYHGPSRYEFRCACCVARGRLDRALKAIADLPSLEAEYHELEKSCGKEKPE